MSTDPFDPDVFRLAIEETSRFLATLSPRDRLHTWSPSYYALDVAAAAQSKAPSDLVRFVKDQVRRRILATLADPADPLANDRVVAEATRIARRMLESCARTYRRRYGSAAIEPQAAPGYAYDALIAWGRAETRRQGAVRDIWAYVAGVVQKRASRDLDASVAAVQPGMRARRRLEQRIFNELMEEDPKRDRSEARRLAAALARERMGRGGGMLTRAGAASAADVVPDGADTQADAQGRAFLAHVREVLATARYTQIDRETWVYYEAAGFVGRDIPWRDVGIEPHTGAQRLLALLRKLEQDLEDWREGNGARE